MPGCRQPYGVHGEVLDRVMVKSKIATSSWLQRRDLRSAGAVRAFYAGCRQGYGTLESCWRSHSSVEGHACMRLVNLGYF